MEGNVPWKVEQLQLQLIWEAIRDGAVRHREDLTASPRPAFLHVKTRGP